MKRWFALLLCLMMALSMLPAAFAQEAEPDGAAAPTPPVTASETIPDYAVLSAT
ncbi:MAG: hypothetical protein II458_04140 [Oscillospiraceae bacterium]|nr:hypothetical protein [Oscillospiraceae bacterium]